MNDDDRLLILRTLVAIYKVNVHSGRAIGILSAALAGSLDDKKQSDLVNAMAQHAEGMNELVQHLERALESR
jgi:hypothetical protein